MGFDAIEPDNMDVNSNEISFDLTAADAVKYVLALDDIGHGVGWQVSQKNVPELTSMRSPHMDFAITGTCLADKWCEQMKVYNNTNRAALAAEYDVVAGDQSALWVVGRQLGLSLVFKDRDLLSHRADCRCRPTLMQIKAAPQVIANI